jgi:hypothetical protein
MVEGRAYGIFSLIVAYPELGATATASALATTTATATA